MIARASELARDCRAALDAYDTPSMTRAVEAFWDDLSNWYVRRSRQRFWEGDRTAFATLHHALVQCLRIMGPVTPFLTEEMWDNLVARGCGPDAPASVHLAGYPEPDEARIAAGLLAPMADVRSVCELGHRARAEAKLRVRQPLASAVVACGDAGRLEALAALGDEIASELNVKAVTTTTDLESLVEQQVVPNFRALGPRLGAKVQEVRAALAAGRLRARRRRRRAASAGEQLAPGEYELRSHAREGFEAQTDGSLVVAIDTRVTDELALEGTARDVVRFLQNVRKELGFDVSDRIAVSYAADERGAAVLAAHGAWIAREVLAERFEAGGGGEHRFAVGRRRDRVRGRARVSAPPRAVVFDCDGLLIDSEVRWAVAERRVVEAHGGAWLPELRERMVGRLGRPHGALHRRVGRAAARRPCRTSCVEVYDGLSRRARRARRRADGRAPTASCRRSRGACRSPSRRTRARQTVRATLAASGLPAVFDLVFTPDRGAAPKPAPDVYLAACEALGVAPAEAVAFEDSPPGAAAARAAGMFVIAVPSDGIHELEADLVLGSLLDLDLAVLGPVTPAARGLRARQAARRAGRVRGRAMRWPTGVRRAGGEPLTCALADGGEGTLAVVCAAGAAERDRGRRARRAGPPAARRDRRLRRRHVPGRGRRGGRPRRCSHPRERDPRRTGSAGLADLLRAALERGATHVLVGARRLGDRGRRPRPARRAWALACRARPGGALLGAIWSSTSRRRARCSRACSVSVLHDVDVPLCGPDGAAALFGPQKGLRREDIEPFDRALARLGEAFGGDVAQRAGAGAAGGLGAALYALGAGRALGLRGGDRARRPARTARRRRPLPDGRGLGRPPERARQDRRRRARRLRRRRRAVHRARRPRERTTRSRRCARSARSTCERSARRGGGSTWRSRPRATNWRRPPRRPCGRSPHPRSAALGEVPPNRRCDRARHSSGVVSARASTRDASRVVAPPSMPTSHRLCRSEA